MGLKILSCGAGMQSTALALMSCGNALYGVKYPEVPVYDAVIFCDLGCEAPWVYEQAEFIGRVCGGSGIPYYKLDTDLYGDYQRNFGEKRVSSIPFWSIGPDGKKAKMRRQCTVDYKINAIHRFVRYELLGYAKKQHKRQEDIGAHEMHIGFSFEEQHRIFDSFHPFFVNKFPLAEMRLKRPDNYKYILETWGLDTKASACCICPFHRNYFYDYLRNNYRDSYETVVAMDDLLAEKQPKTKIRSRLFISRSRKRIRDLTAEDCDDAEMFPYGDSLVWNGF
jgi:hypothetical protein